MEAVKLHQWLEYRYIRHFHVTNEGTGNRIRGAQQKAMGVSRGVPDFFIFHEGKNIAIELKRREGGVVSPEQREWLQFLANKGWHCAIAHGVDDAIEFIEGLEKDAKVGTPKGDSTF